MATPWLCRACHSGCQSVANFKNSAHLANRDLGASLHLQVSNELVAHLSSRAKKADAFFNISIAPRSCLFSNSNCLMRWGSAVSGLPMRWLCVFTICTTNSLKSVSNTLLDFGLLTFHANSVLTTYQTVCFYQAPAASNRSAPPGQAFGGRESRLPLRSIASISEAVTGLLK